MVHKLAPRLGSEEHVADTVTTPARANGTQSLPASSQQRFFQSTIDALPAHIAILSERGQIVAVNRAWREDSERHYAPMVRGRVGDWYLEQGEDDVTSGIQAVLSGTQEEYAIEYRGDYQEDWKWFSLRAAPLDYADSRCAIVTHEDVTRRVEAEHARSEADQALDMLAQAAPLAIIALDIDNRITAWNPAAEEMFGWTRAEALGRFNPIVPETDVPQFLDIVASLADDATNLTDVELHRQRKDGVVLDVSSSIAPLRTADGQIRGSMAVLTDITARKREQEDQRFLAEASELLSSSIDYETTLTQVAQMAVPRLADCCMVHLLESDSSIRRLAVAHADPERQELAQQLKDHGRLQMNGAWGVPVVLRTGEPVIYGDINSRLWDTDNEQIEHIDILRNLGMSSLMVVPLIAREQTIGTLAFVASESGRVYTGSDLDLAMELARRAATAIDNALLHHDVRQAEMRLRTLVEHVPAASYTAQADDLRVMMYVSPQMGLQDDFSADDLIADPGLWLHMLHPDDRERVEAVMLACSASGEPLKVEYRIVSADGQVKWQYDQATLIRDEAGQPLHWQGVCIDITDRKHTEATLRIRARQQAAVAQLGQQAMGDIDLLTFMD
nr:PAS domain S-box protein [Chloroflexia bacterium]